MDGEAQGCGGVNPYCSENGFCYQCRTIDGQVQGCSLQAPFCRNGFCTQCRYVDGEVQGCEANAPYCSEEGFCVQCRSFGNEEVGCGPGFDCQSYRCYKRCDPYSGGEQCENLVCSPNRKVCVECLSAQDCEDRPQAPYCDAYNRCVECQGEIDCPSRICVFGKCSP